jgi:hypothetical protein
MPYRSRSYFRRRQGVAHRTPEQQAAFDHRLERALQLYVSEATYKGPSIGKVAALVLIVVLALCAWILAT